MERAKVIEFFDRVAEKRDKILDTKAENRNRERIVKTLIGMANINKNEKILDVGCGSGSHLLILEKMGFKNLYGSEVSNEMIRLAKRKCKRSKILKDDIEKSKFKSGSFDSIICVSLLYHLVDLYKGLKEMKRVLKPGGKLCISVLNFKGKLLKSIFMKGSLCNIENEPTNKEKIYTSKEMKRALEKLGFRKIHTKEVIFTFSSAPEILIWPNIALEKIVENMPIIRGYARNLLVVCEK